MCKNRLRLITAGVLLLILTGSSFATGTGREEAAALTESELIQALKDLNLERENWSRTFDWGKREEYTQRLLEFNERMETIQLEQLQLQLQLFLLRGDEASVVRVEQHIDRLINPVRGTPLDLPRQNAAGQDDSREGGAK